jgi:DNA-binding NarL/FixJ family response regulator
MSILVIAAEQPAAAVAAALRLELKATVEIATTRRAGQAALRRREFDLVILDQSLVFSEFEAAELLYESASNALLLEFNFALHSADRIVRQVRAAIARHALDRSRAREAAAKYLNSQLNASLAGLLLQSELLLREAPPDLAPKLQHMVELAGHLRDLLRV